MANTTNVTRGLAAFLLAMTIVIPMLIGITANHSDYQGTVKSPCQQPRTEAAPPTLLTSKWNYSTGYHDEISPAIADIDGDGKTEVLVFVGNGVDVVNGSTGVRVRSYLEGEISSLGGSPVVANIYGNGRLQVLFTAFGSLYCYNGTGESQSNWASYPYGVSSSPAVGDVDGDGRSEVIVVTGATYGYFYSLNGTTGVKEWEYPYGGMEGSGAASPTLADLNGDGKLEVLAIRSNTTASYFLYCLNGTADKSGHANSLWKFNLTATENSPSRSSPTVADVDNDGHMEVVIGSYDNKTYCLSSAGALKWNYTTGGHIDSSPTVADIDGDDKLEVLIGSNDNKIYCLDSAGKLKWSYATGGWIQSSPANADIDGDKQLEVLIGSNDTYLYCLNRTGGLEWRYKTGGWIISSPAVADIDKDGKLEVVVGSTDGDVYCLSVASAPVAPTAYPWPSIGYREDIRHTGCITDSDRDGLTDNYEITAGTNPNSKDTDGDTMTDYQEFLISTNPHVDTVQPAAITNLATTTSTNATVTLTWTAPGNNIMSGNATDYLVKFSTSGVITAANWGSATTYTQYWTPARNGTMETRVVSDLTPHTRYWFAIRALDAIPNYGDVSNSPDIWTLITGWQSNATVNLIPGAGNNATMPAGSFKKYGFTITTNNATGASVTFGSSQPPGTGAPVPGLTSFLYLDISGTQTSGTTGAAVYLYYNRSLVQALGIDELTMQIYRWNATASRWYPILSSVTILNSTHGVIVAYLDHFSYFAVYGTTTATSGGNPASLLVIVIMASAVLIVVVAVIVVRRRTARVVVKRAKK